MAVNVLTTAMFTLEVVLLCFLCTSETSAYATYEISSSNHVALPLDFTYLLKFETHSHSRFRRQASGVIADSATNSGNVGQPLSDQSGQTGKNANTSSAASVTTVSPVNTPKVEGTDGLNENNDTIDKSLFDEADVIHDHHDYYTSDIISNKFSEHWIELENAPRHETLSTAHRVAAVTSLMFDFYFYGHKVNNVTVATGGFLYMSPFVHQWLTATQYIAPLMANFDPSISNDSSIYVQSEKNRFIVEYKGLVLRDQNSTGKFHFQVILKEDNSIKFVYKSVPFPISNISTDEHPVKIGLSDAYYNDTYIPGLNIKRRTIYEYHKVALPMPSVVSQVVIILTPLPTCNRLTDCDSCTKHTNVQFDCLWCGTLRRCSDGLDWYRQHWDREGCQLTSVDKCEESTTESPATSVSPVSDKPLVTGMTKVDKSIQNKSENQPISKVTAATALTSVSTIPAAGDTTHNSVVLSTVVNIDADKDHMTDCGHTKDAEACSNSSSSLKPISDPMHHGPCSSVDKCEESTTESPATSVSPVSDKPLVTGMTKVDKSVQTTSENQPVSKVTAATALTSVSTIPAAGGTTHNSVVVNTVVNMDADKDHMTDCGDGKCNKKSEFPVAVVVIVVLVMCGLLAGLTGWVYYAYTHPTSRSGMWLMEHRPSQIRSKIKFWKSSSDAGTKYKVESEA